MMHFHADKSTSSDGEKPCPMTVLAVSTGCSPRRGRWWFLKVIKTLSSRRFNDLLNKKSWMSDRTDNKTFLHQKLDKSHIPQALLMGNSSSSVHGTGYN